MLRFRTACCTFLAVLLVFSAAARADSEPLSFRKVSQALEYIEQNQPEELDLGVTKMSPTDLRTIKRAMPENGALHFTMKWEGLTVSDTDRDLDLNGAQNRLTEDQMEALIELVPEVQTIDVSKGYRLANDLMIRLVEKYPEIQFIWLITLNSGHSLVSTDTAYSTFNGAEATNKLTSEQMELLKYAPGLKALDLGHNKLTSLDFLRYFPDLEFLILACNKEIDDIEILGTMKHLQYLELFTVAVSDISPLANCTELLDLNLSFCNNITDLSPLAGLTKLERFWGTKMENLPEEQKEAFVRDHPQTEYSFLAFHATSDGWREHPRYDHYLYCLHNRVWIPFDQPLPEK